MGYQVGQETFETRTLNRMVVRVHSMRSATKYPKIRKDIFEEVLVEKGFGHRDRDGLFVLDAILTVSDVENMRDEKARFLSSRDAEAFLGVSETIFKELQRNQTVLPRTGQGLWGRKGYDAKELQKLLDKSFAGTQTFESAPDYLQTLPKVTRQV